MSDVLRCETYLNFSRHETEVLLQIWRSNDRYKWSDTTFDVIREILSYGNETSSLPPQGRSVDRVHSLKPTVHVPGVLVAGEARGRILCIGRRGATRCAPAAEQRRCRLCSVSACGPSDQ